LCVPLNAVHKFPTIKFWYVTTLSLVKREHSIVLNCGNCSACSHPTLFMAVVWFSL